MLSNVLSLKKKVCRSFTIIGHFTLGRVFDPRSFYPMLFDPMAYDPMAYDPRSFGPMSVNLYICLMIDAMEPITS